MRENKTCPDQGWQQLPTKELDQILQAELEKEHPDEEVVLPILQELEEREKDRPVIMTPEVLETIEKLSKYETPSKQSINRPGWIAGVAAVAAVACIVILALPRPAEAEGILDRFFRWTSSVFEFFTPEQEASNPPVDVRFETDDPGLRQLYDKVTDLGVTEQVVPMWLPHGFELTELKEQSMSGGKSLHCKFENGNNLVLITYRISSDITAKLEKEEDGVELFEYGEVCHFIVENEENLSVKWTAEGVECLLNANVAKEDLYTILKSIYRSELSK